MSGQPPFRSPNLLNQPGYKNRPLAGSTDLVLLLRRNPDLCDRVVDISLIPEMHTIEKTGNDVIIGASASFSEIISQSNC
jgi:CO/xanthine dehydrogenase FAD-binding subunit